MNRLESTTEVRLEPVKHAAAESIRLLQTTQQCFMIHRVKGDGQVEQRQSSMISAVYRSKNVQQHQERRQHVDVLPQQTNWQRIRRALFIRQPAHDGDDFING